jgi:predicted NBD/HSP70 family sugar kinase
MSLKKDLPGLVLPIRTATPSSVRAVNRSIMLELIRRRQPVSRADLARFTGIFRSSVSDIVDELVEDNLVAEERAVPSQRGRVPMSLRLNDAGYPVVGVNIRPAYCQIARAGLNGRIHTSLTFQTPPSPKKLVRAIVRAIRRWQEEASRTGAPKFRRIGIAIPGHVDASSGRILWSPTHTELADFPITREIFEQTAIETLADNDCNLGALSELRLANEESKERSANFVFLNVSDFGAGAGAVLNGEIYLGHDANFAAEVGHLIVEPQGVACRCGRRGCWERYVSNEATWRRIHPRTPFTVERFNEMLTAGLNGDARVRAAFRETARYLSLGISNIGYLFNPAEIIVAGRITAIWNLLRADVERFYGSAQLRHSIRPARLSADDSLLHGAVCLALRDAFAKPKFGEMMAGDRETA